MALDAGATMTQAAMSRWTDEELRELVTLWPTNSASQIAKAAPPALGDMQEGRAAMPGGSTQ